jgi:hypothetical protein
MAIATIGAPAERLSRPEAIKARILRVVAAGGCWPGWRGEPDRWRHLPGTLPWWEVRQRLGGRVSASDFAGAVEDLLAEGRLIEVWLQQVDDRDAPHLLMLPGRSGGLKRPVARARGDPVVLTAEPWYAGLSAVEGRQGGAKAKPRRQEPGG